MISILRNLIKFPKTIKWEITRCLLCNIGCSVILTEIRLSAIGAEYVSPITPKYDRILKKSIKENSKEYASFVKLSKTPKEVKGHVVVNYTLAENDKGEVAQNLNAIRENLHPKFTFMDFVKVAQEGQCVINMNNVLDDTVNAQRYVRIYLVYKFGDSLGKRILFNDLDFEIKGGRL